MSFTDALTRHLSGTDLLRDSGYINGAWTAGGATKTFDIINPALAQRVDWVWFVICQVAFGLVGGYVVFKSEKVQTMQSWTMAERLSLHAMEKK